MHELVHVVARHQGRRAFVGADEVQLHHERDGEQRVRPDLAEADRGRVEALGQLATARGLLPASEPPGDYASPPAVFATGESPGSRSRRSGHSGATAPVSHRLPRTIALMAANLSNGSARSGAPIRAESANCDFHDTPDARPPRSVRCHAPFGVPPRRAARRARARRGPRARPAPGPLRRGLDQPGGPRAADRRGARPRRGGRRRSSTSATSAPGAGARWPSSTTRTRSPSAAWIEDPAAAPHGGESLLALLERVRGLARRARGRRRADGGRHARGRHPRGARVGVGRAGAGVLALRRGALVAHGAARA